MPTLKHFKNSTTQRQKNWIFLTEQYIELSKLTLNNVLTCLGSIDVDSNRLYLMSICFIFAVIRASPVRVLNSLCNLDQQLRTLEINTPPITAGPSTNIKSKPTSLSQDSRCCLSGIQK